jgi:hypothetical protein
VMREKLIVSAWIIDRNIKTNGKAENLSDKIRDLAVGIGAVSVFSKIQWNALAKGLLKKEP